MPTKAGKLTHLEVSKTKKFIAFCKELGVKPTRTRARKLRNKGMYNESND